MWAEPDLEHAMELMRHVHTHQEETIHIGGVLKQGIADNFNWSTIGGKIVHVLRGL
jgi:hypothetical protein